MPFADDVKDTLMQVISSVAAHPESSCINPGKDFSRNRKLPLTDLLKFCICMGDGSTKKEILQFFDYSADAPSNSAFLQQREKLHPDVFNSIFHLFNFNFKPALYMDKYQLVACDGSAFSYTKYPQDADCYFPPDGKSSSGYNQAHVITLYDILSKRYCDAVIQPARLKNEYLAMAQIVQRLSPSCGVPVFIADRGFASYNIFANVIERGFFFLIRADKKRFQAMLGSDYPQQPSFDIHITRILTRSTSIKKRLHPELGSLYRYICNNVPFDFIEPRSGIEYTMHLRALRFSINANSYENIITNLPDDIFTLENIKDLYHLRWDIENSFREFKYILGAGRFHSRKFKFICMEIWARMVLYNFCSTITTGSIVSKKGPKHAHQVNRTIIFNACIYLLGLHPGEDPPDIDALVARNTLPVRHDRSFIRHLRTRVPTIFLYRT